MTAKAITRRAFPVSLALVALCAYLLWHSRHEPLHKGKPISFWVNGACNFQAAYGEPYSYGDCIQELRQIGPPVIPYLIAKLRIKDSWPRRKWAALLNELPPKFRRHFPPVPDVNMLHYEAALRLTEFGPDAKMAVPDLVKSLQETNLASIVAANTLGAIGPDATTAIPALKQALSRSDLLTQTIIASAIWRIDRETNFVIQIYEQAMKLHPEDGEAMNAELGLGDMGPAAAPAIPLLVRQLENDTLLTGIQRNAALALGQIGVKDQSVIAALAHGTNSPSYEVSGYSTIALWQLDSHQYAPIVAPIVTRLAVILNGRTLLDLVATNHLEIAPAIPALRELSKNDNSPVVRKFAADALEKIDARADNTSTNQ
jgi:HEAT repeat protein